MEVNGKEGFYRVTYKDGRVFEINDKGLSLGSKDQSVEKAVLGDTLKSSHDSTIDQVISMNDALQVLTVPTALGPSGIPINAAAFIAINVQLEAIKADTGKYLSDKVTLD